MLGKLHLRTLRIVVAVLFLTALTLIFLDLWDYIPAWFKEVFLFLQFVPSTIHFITTAGWLSLGFIVVMVFTVLFGRVYCSFICPLGIFQDIITRVANVFRKTKRRFRFLKPRFILRYSFLFVAVVAAISGFIIIVGWLDPFSIFGRFMTHTVRPIFIHLINNVSSLLYDRYIFWLTPIDFRAFSWVSLGAVLTSITIIIWMSAAYGRQYCNTVCPVGTLLGLISRFSVFSIRLDREKCNSCGLCQNSCKAGCIDANTKNVDMSRCVGCFNCLKACSLNGVLYNKGRLSVSREAGESRRYFIAKTATLFLTGFGLTKIIAQPVSSSQAMIPEHKEFPVSPPGSLSIEHFTSRCSACHLCVSVCPKQVLQPALFEYGLQGFLQPRMDYHTSYCCFDCTLCGEVCPTGAILPLTIEQKQVEQIGKVVFIRRNCIVRTDQIDCGACSVHCPTKAVEMVPWRSFLMIPTVHPDICIGCGACEYACPTTPYKAIYVDGNPVHLKAAKPGKAEQEKVPDTGEDFPF